MTTLMNSSHIISSNMVTHTMTIMGIRTGMIIIRGTGSLFHPMENVIKQDNFSEASACALAFFIGFKKNPTKNGLESVGY